MNALGGNRFPGLTRQVRNVAAAATRAVGAVVRRQSILVPAAVRAEREAICAACEENLVGRCRKCGCGVRAQLIRKTHLATEQCPLDPPKWETWRANSTPV